jgi:hypothetical protein
VQARGQTSGCWFLISWFRHDYKEMVTWRGRKSTASDVEPHMSSIEIFAQMSSDDLL